MKASFRFITGFLFLVYIISGQEAYTQKKICAKGDYTHSQTMTVFPVIIDSFQRKDIYSFDKKKTNIGVVYENQQNETIISIYVYPAGDGYEGRLRKEYLKSLQSISNFTHKGIHVTQFAVKYEGEKYICNGFKAIFKNDKSKFNSLTIYEKTILTNEEFKYNSLAVYECGKWFLKVRITSNDLDSTKIGTLEQKIYNQFDPTRLTALNPLDSLADVYFFKTAFRDSVLLGSAMGSAYKKIDWALANIKENERASGFPDLYLDLQVESLKEFLQYQYRFNEKKSEFTTQYLKELQLISDAGFLPEFVMEQFGMIMIVPENRLLKYKAYDAWKQHNKITIDLNQEFCVVSYGQKK
ncbi:MAG: hypothetical protein ACOYOT_05455 [Bacteroidales bacterium]